MNLVVTRLKNARRVLAFLAGMLAVASLAGCVTTKSGPNLREIYETRARYHGPERRPVIVIPGILGSRLEQNETGRVVWGAFERKYANPNQPDGARLIALPMKTGKPLYGLRDGVRAVEVLGTLDLNFLFVPIQAQAYAGIMGALGIGGFQDSSLNRLDYGDDHFTCFQFPYDWRRDNAENAAKLHEFVLEKQAYVSREMERRYGIVNPDVKFDLVSHSMGGLLTRYFLRYGSQPLPEDGSLPDVTWEGAKYVDRVILVGPPNAGSTQALTSLLEGDRQAPILPRYPAAIIGTLPAAYQLLPRSNDHIVLAGVSDDAAPVDVLDPAVWEQLNWGLLDPKQTKVLKWLLPDVRDAASRRTIALDHVRKSLRKARQFQAALDVPAIPPSSLHLQLITGDAIETPSIVHFDTQRRKLITVRTSAGDGIVTRRSALMDQRTANELQQELRSPIQWQRVTFIFDDHVGMTSNPQFVDNVLYSLLEEPRIQSPALPEQATIENVDPRQFRVDALPASLK